MVTLLKPNFLSHKPLYLYKSSVIGETWTVTPPAMTEYLYVKSLGQIVLWIQEWNSYITLFLSQCSLDFLFFSYLFFPHRSLEIEFVAALFVIRHWTAICSLFFDHVWISAVIEDQCTKTSCSEKKKKKKKEDKHSYLERNFTGTSCSFSKTTVWNFFIKNQCGGICL